MIPQKLRPLAACQTDPEAMYCDPGDTAAVHAAKQICRRCPIRNACLNQAMAQEEPWGIWGGFTEPERQRLAAGRHPKACNDCGTPFVGLADQRRCGHCNLKQPTGGSPIVSHRYTIAALAAAGKSDTEIGAALGYPKGTVRSARRRWGITSGQAVRHQRHATSTIRRELARCGTLSALRRHLRRHEPVDEACRRVGRAESADRRAAAREQVEVAA